MHDLDAHKTTPPASIEALPRAAAAKQQPLTIGRYRVEKVLGEGGFGRVFLAHDDVLKRPVAIKVPQPERVAQAKDVEAYLAEARTVAALDHPHIVPVYDVGRTDDNLCFVVSKFIEGCDLAGKTRETRLSFAESAELAATVAEALQYAHKQGLVHRDVKPSNILIDADGKPYLADFGLALTEEDFGKGAGLAGTPAYMSPEQARGEGHRVDGRSDIFSLGVVFYELLTGRRPFQADSVEEMLELIAGVEARPPRQINDSIPKELERICLKALAKRARERYTTAKDMADDLRHFLDEQTAGPVPATIDTAEGSRNPVSPRNRVSEASDAQPLRIVPKGLRSFDAHDADFFLELLPGPRDRDGLPDNLRFWKTRIEETDPDNTFSVGLIYGPSGCGKSSLAKAGLLPRLSEDVIAVYLEATAEDTETRLLNGLRKRCPGLPADLSLAETLSRLRRNPVSLRNRVSEAAPKVLIVLDQFEQWLHAKREEQNTELVQALRQCDGERVQCIVMVRDDFWMAATRFMRDLEIRLVEGQNSAAVDLFDCDHARKVLAAFGRAFGKLPDPGSRIRQNAGVSRPPSGEGGYQFLEQAVAGLAQDGKVICVRLALFAEMMKGKAWTPGTLAEVGGTEGVGVTFLEETFSTATAPPEHRYHQGAARAVLKALLPESGTDIKGHMRSHEELLQASGYAGRPQDFAGLLRILDSELRLITPTDLEGPDRNPVSPRNRVSETQYYQLTHDYLVHSLREWLTRKQKETRRGRAELLLADRAAVWNARPENRQLPSLWQWSSIRWWTRKKNWTPPQRKMMGKASRYHVARGMVVGVLLAVATITGLRIRDHVQDQRKATHAAGLVQAVLNAETAQVPAIIGEMADYRRWVDPLLREENDKPATSSRQRLHAGLALLPVDPNQKDYLYQRLQGAAPHEVGVLRDALAPYKDELRDKLWATVEQPAKNSEPRLRAASVLAAYDPDSQRWDKSTGPIADQLVAENPVFLGLWMEGFRPIKTKLLAPLANIYRDNQRRESERTLATNMLADYAADQPQVLADLLMDADDKQFLVLLPKLQSQGAPALGPLFAELDKKPAPPRPGQEILKKEGSIAADDPKVKVSAGQALPAKLFEVEFKAGKKYRLSLAGKEIDAFLVLQDKTGKELAFDDDSGGKLDSLIEFTAPRTEAYKVHAAALQGQKGTKDTGAFVLTITEGPAAALKDDCASRQANAAIALLRMNEADKVWPLFRHAPDPSARSWLIHRLGPQGVDLDVLLTRFDTEEDVSARRALLLSMGEYSPEGRIPPRAQALLPRLLDLYRIDPDPGLHAAAAWLLGHWGHRDKVQEVDRQLAKKLPIEQQKPETRNSTWWVNSQGQTMITLPGPLEFLMGSPPTEEERFDHESQHNKRIGRSFALAAKPVTVAEYRRFNKGYTFTERYAPAPDCPVVSTSWYQAAAYCNWLSKQEGIADDQWCYETSAQGQVTKLKANYLNLTGYRLPTEAESEYACRAGAVTSRYYGESVELLGKYGWYLQNSKERSWPVGTKKPNDFGFFDMHGNVWNWCQERYLTYPQAGKIVDDIEDTLSINNQDSRVLRGGSFVLQPSNVRSAYRTRLVPSTRLTLYGFRVARTLPLGSFTALLPTPEGGRK